MAEGARLESVYTPKGYPGFESLFLRQTIEQWSQKVLNYLEMPHVGAFLLLIKETNFSPLAFILYTKKYTNFGLWQVCTPY